MNKNGLKNWGTLIGLFVLYTICPYLFASIFYPFVFSENKWVCSFANLGMYIFTTLVLLYIVRKDFLLEWKEFKKTPKKYLNKGFVYWIYGMVVMILSNLIVSSIVKDIATNEQVTRELLFKFPIYALPTIVFFGPLLEEIVFRFGFRKPFKRKIPYAFFSALAFGMLHVFTAFDSLTLSSILSHITEFLFIIPYGALGFFFAKAYYETENIFSSIVPHMFHNTLSVSLILLLNFM